MSKLYVVGNEQRDKHVALNYYPEFDQLDDPIFGLPPSRMVGILTGLVGFATGVLSLIIFFFLFRPDSPITPDWLVFLLIGSVAGYFLRFERGVYKGMLTGFH